ncbi:hypothetical protein GCM10009557_89160 [Virgisporangium ochraceum]|uniref:3-methyladenine DNA glycosylase n=1 Tax=Virgisporangium ochraceum TaxID=65505 RepID=A0A8J4EC28_9ACTN|nr:3-methyladenine DNA glycosylase [Virgisporangium ochraceum]GIJ69281.1 hypothetical protein Voc01_041980 [Virgisporangium ochraceum]
MQSEAEKHERRVDALLHGHLERRRRGVKHPVEDFLFTYYSHRPAQLRKWRPDTTGIRPEHRARAQWIRDLLANTAKRPPHLGCFGLHEWAMVYRLDQREVRHTAWPLRLSQPEIARLLEERQVRCSHFDAFRFFTPPARSLNLLQPTRDTQHDLEQPGCLHANMDLYKWSFKLAPLVGSPTVVDCFELARDIRTLDMRASPYDLRDLGYEPVRIETPAGRAEYTAAQKAFADRAAPLRERLIAIVDRAFTA